MVSLLSNTRSCNKLPWSSGALVHSKPSANTPLQQVADCESPSIFCVGHPSGPAPSAGSCLSSQQVGRGENADNPTGRYWGPALGETHVTSSHSALSRTRGHTTCTGRSEVRVPRREREWAAVPAAQPLPLQSRAALRTQESGSTGNRRCKQAWCV